MTCEVSMTPGDEAVEDAIGECTVDPFLEAVAQVEPEALRCES
jgi:hypothetical protein